MAEQVKTPVRSVSEPDTTPPIQTDVAGLPEDELRRYGRELGLAISPRSTRFEVLDRVRARQALLMRLERDHLLELIKWARIPVRRSESRDGLARRIAGIKQVNFDDLSDDALRTLAQLRDMSVDPDDSRDHLIRRLKKAEPMSDWIKRKRNALVGKVLAQVFEESPDNHEDEYRFLPEDKGAHPATLEREIAHRGIVSGLASRLRGAADDYVAAKLDEIEARIDRKLDEIDRRLSDWRDQEVANRLRIIRITLIASVLVAVLSLAYKASSSYWTNDAPSETTARE
jgi:hypothetical protein